jgi:hypothetical protein
MGQPALPVAERIKAAAVTVRRVSQEAGIVPDEPLHAVVTALADAVDALAELPAATAQEMAPVETRMRELTATAQQVAQRPLLDTIQIRYEILPHLLAVVRWSQAIVGALLLIAAFGAGCGYMYWRTPTLPTMQCAVQSNGGTFCGYWTVAPTQQK